MVPMSEAKMQTPIAHLKYIIFLGGRRFGVGLLFYFALMRVPPPVVGRKKANLSMTGMKSRLIVAAWACFIISVGVCSGETLVFRGIMLGQNIEAAHTVFHAKNSNLIETGSIKDGEFSIGAMVYRGKYFPLDQTSGVVVADDLGRVQSIVCRPELLEKIAGFPFADARMVVEWLITELKLPGMDAVQVGRPALDPYSYEFRAQSSRPPYYLRILADKMLLIQSLTPNRLKTFDKTQQLGVRDEL